MSRAEELWILTAENDLTNGEDVLFMEDEQTHQTSFEPLNSITINQQTEDTLYFTASSLGRRVRGYYSPRQDSQRKGRAVLTILSD